MKLIAAFLLAILICLPIFGQTANPQQSSAQQPSGTPGASTAGQPSNSSKGSETGRWRKIRIKVVEPPDNATAQCNDLTYSSSQHVSGTCAKHGGVKQWLKPVTLE
jgi:hypothetical protein